MNLDLCRRLRSGFMRWIAVSGILLCACSTPSDKKEGAAVTQSVQQEAAPSQTAVTAETSSTPQILDVAVTQRSGNRTRLSITTDKKVDYNVKLDGTTLLVDLKNGAVKEGLMKKLDSEHAAGAIQRVQAFSSATDRHVSLRVTLRQLVPYHITRDGTVLNVDFDAVYAEAPRPRDSASVVVPEPQRRDPAPVVVPEPRTRPAAQTAVPQPGNRAKKQDAAASDATDSRAGLFEATSKQYAGQRMSFDFVDSDIRNILQLISEVAGINIVWGSDVEGKISMKLDNIPWDQALEMILRPNGLTYQIEDDVLWVVPKKKLEEIEITEESRKSSMLAAKKQQEMFEAKIIEFITIRHRKANDIYTLLVGGEMETREIDETGKLLVKTKKVEPLIDIDEGSIEGNKELTTEEGDAKKVDASIKSKDLFVAYDSGTNTLVLNGIRSKVEKVKEIVQRLDVAGKQVLIEARIVEASTQFARDLGIEWQTGVKADWINTGSNSSGSTSFTTNAPAGWTSNIGLSLGWLTGGGLGAITLDAALALGETDQKAHIISAPRVMTVNGSEALIKRGVVDYFPVVTRENTNYKEIEAVLSLKVTPTVSADNSHVTMVVDVTDDQPKPATRKETSQGTITDEETQIQEEPTGRTTKRITSTLMVRTGDTVVIGGIYKQLETVTDSGVPWLMDIPVLGWLFKAEYDTRERTELLIFLTPSVVDPLKAPAG